MLLSKQIDKYLNSSIAITDVELSKFDSETTDNESVETSDIDPVSNNQDLTDQ